MLNNAVNIAIDRIKTLLKNNDKDIPVCAVIFNDKEIISIKTNKKELEQKVTSHAEILAIEEANKKLGSWRLNDYNIFITLEPCPMCAWAILNARIKKVYFGSYDTQYGAFGSKINLNEISNFKAEIIGGIKEKECDKILKEYFEGLR